MATLNFDLSETGNFDSYSLLDPGEYAVRITDSSITETRSGESRLTFVYTVDGTNRKVFDNLSFWSSNPKAVDMAKKKLKSIAIACGHKNPNYVADSSELHGKQMLVTLGIRESNGREYQDVKGYAPMKPAAKSSFARPAPSAAPASSPKPWE